MHGYNLLTLSMENILYYRKGNHSPRKFSAKNKHVQIKKYLAYLFQIDDVIQIDDIIMHNHAIVM